MTDPKACADVRKEETNGQASTVNRSVIEILRILQQERKKVYNVTPSYLIGQTRNCLADLVLLSD